MTTLKRLDGTHWHGTCELWLDPEGNAAAKSECTLVLEDSVLRYTWSHEGTEHTGTLTVRDDGVSFADTFHSAQPMHCDHIERAGAALAALGHYEAGDGPPWGWLTVLSLRPADELVLQMTNIAPWGEDGRAVRMVCARSW